MAQKLVLFLHGIALFNFVFGIYYDLNHLQLPEPFKSNVENSGAFLKGRTAFLTFLNMVSLTFSNFIKICVCSLDNKISEPFRTLVHSTSYLYHRLTFIIEI